MMQNMFILAAADAAKSIETAPNVNGTVMSLIIGLCTLLIAAVIAIYIHSKSR